MEDSELTRKAIDELMDEMNEYKEKESIPTERKKNPLGKPNKLFLGRTINSMMKHNKRQTERNLQRCKRKIKELDAKQTSKKFRKHRKDSLDNLERSRKLCSESSDDEFARKRRQLMKRKKKNRRKKKYCSRSSSTSTSCSNTTISSSSSNSSDKTKNRNRKKKRHKSIVEEKKYEQVFYNDYISDPTLGYYVDPNMAYAVMAYNQMNHMIKQQQKEHDEMVKKELVENVEIPSDLSISYYSSTDSSLNISLHSSSAEEDENGILTLKLSSDEEEVSSSSQNTNKRLPQNSNIEIISLSCDDESVHSHISLETKDSQNSLPKANDEICILSSSDSEDVEIVATIS